MMKNNLIIMFVFFSQYQFLMAQTNPEKIITGTVFSDSTKLEGISVINCMNKMMAVTDKEGCFSIQAKQGDILNFSGIDYKYLKKFIYKHEYAAGTLEVYMIFNSVELDEVIVNKDSGINAVSLGIIPKAIKKFTPQERRLYSNSGGFMGVINTLSGQKSILKENVELEKKEIILKKMEYSFKDVFYTKTLKIPVELIKGFQYYCVENSEFVKYMNLQNKEMCMFLMTNLALVYNKNRIEN